MGVLSFSDDYGGGTMSVAMDAYNVVAENLRASVEAYIGSGDTVEDRDTLRLAAKEFERAEDVLRREMETGRDSAVAGKRLDTL